MKSTSFVLSNQFSIYQPFMTNLHMSYREQYARLTDHIVPGPQGVSYFIPIVLLPIALIIPRTILSRWQAATLFLPIMVGSTIHAWMQMKCVDVISVNVVLWSLYFLALKDVHGKFGRVRRGTSLDRSSRSNGYLQKPDDSQEYNSITVQYYPRKIIDRLPWVGTLLASIRMNNWLTGDPSHDRRQPPTPAFKTRRALARQALICFIRGYLVLDITTAYIVHDEYFTNAMIPITSPTTPFARLSPIASYVLRTVVIGLQGWAALSQFTYVLCLLPITLNALRWLPDDWSPHTWTPLYGSASIVLTHGVRGFWSQYWHQSMRIMTSAPGYAIADALRLKQGGLLRYGVITSVAFFLSGCVHMGLVPPEPLYAVEDANLIRLRVSGFFWLQPVAIVAEAMIGRTIVRLSTLEWRQARSTLVLRTIVNALFITVWSLICLPLLGEMARQIGYWHMLRMPFSVVQYLSKLPATTVLFEKLQAC